ncbi:O-antigen ligase family protein [Aggregicoccus sp. 17bor-14]|uniref:O-antigen ligase family protein n=1 Tax=Myxococcaceae TaxID=31 RepID=UPI00129CC5A9|nr:MULTISPECIES: O-antigen ligase [Myxococcaceae]MBF5042765.1 O-antigen ligase family protein [Simulacricoccus sp. 17bor-14]MRI88533.1 O-antigen ligase family protein [Aggregicoccus sp. 17bor-14]
MRQSWSPPHALAYARAPRSTARSLLRRAEHLFVVLVLVLLGEALIPLLKQGGSSQGSEGDPVQMMLWLGIYGVTATFVVLRWRTVRRGFRRGKAVLGLTLLSIGSAAWSLDGSFTFRKALILAGTTFFGAYLAGRFNGRELLQRLSEALVLSLLLSVVFALFLPSYGIDRELHEGAWQGVYAQKNILGRISVLAAFTLAIQGAAGRARWRWRACAALALVVLVLSRSMTSLSMAVFLVLLTPLYKCLRWRLSVLVPVLVLSVVLLASALLALAINFELVLGGMGRDLSLTGRTAIWPSVWEAIQLRPWLGYGYGAFWAGFGGAVDAVREASGWEVRHSHNGFLELWLDVGAVGLALFVAGLLSTFVDAARVARHERSAQGLWPLLFLSFLVAYNLTETLFLRQNNLFWVLYVAVSLGVAGRRNRWVEAPRFNPMPQPGAEPL